VELSVTAMLSDLSAACDPNLHCNTNGSYVCLNAVAYRHAMERLALCNPGSSPAGPVSMVT